MIIILTIVLAWLFTSGMAYPMVLNSMVNGCPHPSHGSGQDDNYRTTYIGCREYHRGEARAVALLGPIIIPFHLGSKLTNTTDRTESRRASELSEAEHRKKVAKLNAETLSIQEKEAGLR